MNKKEFDRLMDDLWHPGLVVACFLIVLIVVVGYCRMIQEMANVRGQDSGQTASTNANGPTLPGTQGSYFQASPGSE